MSEILYEYMKIDKCLKNAFCSFFSYIFVFGAFLFSFFVCTYIF